MRQNKILERFYRMFKIPKVKLDYPDNFDEFYPEITDSMYMKLISLNVRYLRDDYILRNRSLKTLKDKIIKEVQEIFKED